MDTADLRVVAEDLEYFSQWRDDISDADIRRGSATLRRMLIEGTYSNAWRAAGFEREPTLVAVDLANIVAERDFPRVVLALAGGAAFRGIHYAAFVVNEGTEATTPPNDAVLSPEGHPGERLFSVSEIVKSSAGYAFGDRITRGEVIKYIANVKGGVHLTPKDRKREAKLVARVGKLEKRIIVHQTEGLLVELVALAQAIGRSDDARRFIDRARSRAPEAMT